MKDYDPTTTYGIFGTGGLGRETMAQWLQSLGPSTAHRGRLVFVEDAPAVRTLNGMPVLSTDEFLALEKEPLFTQATFPATYYNVAIGKPEDRRQVVARLDAGGSRPFNISAPHVSIFQPVTIGEGCLLAENAIISSDGVIGRHFQMNFNSVVGHDATIEDFVTFAPGAHINGYTHVKEGAYIGSGAVARQGSKGKPLVIGRWAVIGMGAVVLDDVPDYAIVVGNPARVLRTKRPE